MTETTPSARPAAFAALTSVPVVLTLVRYRLGVGTAPVWQAAYVLAGVALCLGLLVAFHGRAVLQNVQPRAWIVLAISVGAALGLWYFGRREAYHAWFGVPRTTEPSLTRLRPFLFMSLSAATYRLVVPFAFARLALGWSARSLGLRVAPHDGVRGIGWVYLVCFLVVLPFVVHASAAAPFLAKYPFGRELVSKARTIEIGPFLVYQAFYFLLFCSAEALWRGFVTFGLERDLGLYGIALMLVPYAVSHFGKPLPEVLGSVIAGAALGFFALKHRSFLLGVALHYAVALTMDLLAIFRSGITFRWSG